MEFENIDNSEMYCDDFYLNSSHKKVKSYGKLSVDKARANVIRKVQQLPISKNSAEIISKLIINHKIKDIVKVLKIGKKSVTILAKANVENKAFELLKDTDKIVIKVFYDTADMRQKLYAYSRNIYDEEKEPSCGDYPIAIERDVNFLRQQMILHQVDNVILMKMFEGSKTISQVLEENPRKISSIYQDILSLIVDIKGRDGLFWDNDNCGIKNIVFWNQKWILLSSQDDHEILRDFLYDRDVNIRKNLIDLIDLFRDYGMRMDELEKGFVKYINGNSWNWKGSMYYSICHQYFQNEIVVKRPRRYISTTSRYARYRTAHSKKNNKK